RDPSEALVTWRFGRRMLAEGAWLAAGVLSAYLWVIWQAGAGPRATTMAFMALVLIHPFQAMNCRSEQFGWWRLPSNPLTWIALVTLVGLQWLSISWSPLARLLGTMPLSATDWLVLGAGVLWPTVGMEIAKGWGARRGLRPPSEPPPKTACAGKAIARNGIQSLTADLEGLAPTPSKSSRTPSPQR